MRRSSQGPIWQPARLVLLPAVMVLLAGFPVMAFNQTMIAADPLSPVGEVARQSLQLLRAGNSSAAAAALAQFEPRWSAVEDGIRAESPAIYARIEVAASRAEAALAAAPPDTVRAAQALEALAAAVSDYSNGAVRGRGCQGSRAASRLSSP